MRSTTSSSDIPVVSTTTAPVASVSGLCSRLESNRSRLMIDASTSSRSPPTCWTRRSARTRGDAVTGRVTVDGVDATAAIRGRDVTDDVSQVAANPAVRETLVGRQREWAVEHGGGVIEGRDIGSVVFPEAQLKLYVTASPRVRAERRVQQVGGDLDEVEASIIKRDRFDSSREHSPLTEATGAVVVDTTGMSLDEVVDHIVSMLEGAS